MGREGAAVEENRVNSWGHGTASLHIYMKSRVFVLILAAPRQAVKKRMGKYGEIRTIFPGERLT